MTKSTKLMIYELLQKGEAYVSQTNSVPMFRFEKDGSKVSGNMIIRRDWVDENDGGPGLMAVVKDVELRSETGEAVELKSVDETAYEIILLRLRKFLWLDEKGRWHLLFT